MYILNKLLSEPSSAPIGQNDLPFQPHPKQVFASDRAHNSHQTEATVLKDSLYFNKLLHLGKTTSKSPHSDYPEPLLQPLHL